MASKFIEHLCVIASVHVAKFSERLTDISRQHFFPLDFGISLIK